MLAVVSVRPVRPMPSVVVVMMVRRTVCRVRPVVRVAVFRVFALAMPRRVLAPARCFPPPLFLFVHHLFQAIRRLGGR